MAAKPCCVSNRIPEEQPGEALLRLEGSFTPNPSESVGLLAKATRLG